MSIRIGINGFGRIGRAVFRIVAMGTNEIEVTHINDLATPSVLANLLKYDSTFGRFLEKVESTDLGLLINGKLIPVSNERDPEKIPWRRGEVDVVLESSGHFRTREAMEKHFEGGAPKILLSAPAKGEKPIDATVILGVNETSLTSKMKLVSNASCTSNQVS